MALDDDTFSDSDSSSSGDTYVYMGSSHCHGHRHNSGSGWALAIILVFAVIIIAIAANGDKSHGERREQQTDAMIKTWADSMNVTVAEESGKPAYSCQHERSRALCDVRLNNGEMKHVSCGKGGCSER